MRSRLIQAGTLLAAGLLLGRFFVPLWKQRKQLSSASTPDRARADAKLIYRYQDIVSET